jgi:hypothetical protein
MFGAEIGGGASGAIKCGIVCEKKKKMILFAAEMLELFVM